MKSAESDDISISSVYLQSPYSPLCFCSDMNTPFAPSPDPYYMESPIKPNIGNTKRNSAIPMPIVGSPYMWNKQMFSPSTKRVCSGNMRQCYSKSSMQMNPFASLQNLERCVEILRESPV